MKKLVLAFLLGVLCSTANAQTIIGRQLVDQYPKDANGTLTYGLTWLPQSYANTTRRYPLIIALHGSGETGTTIASLNNMCTASPRQLPGRIADGWNATAINPLTGIRDSFIVISPQAPTWSYDYSQLLYILPNVVQRYRVDTSRIYLTGLSAGGGGAFTTLGSYDSTFLKKFAAVATASSAGVNAANGFTDVQVEAHIRYASMWGVHVWTIGGEQDYLMETDVRYHDSTNILSPVPPNKLTVIQGVGHASWQQAYDTLYRPKLNYYGNSVACNNGCAFIISPNNNGSPVMGSGVTDDSLNMFEWFLKYHRTFTVSSTPTANAGSDQVVVLPVNTTTLTGSGTAGTGHTIVSYLWTYISGPAGAVLVTPNAPATIVNNLAQGIYVFRLTVKNEINATATDDVQITVNNPAPSADNIAPTVTVGAGQTITLPTNTVSLTSNPVDFDGTISQLNWTKLSSPGQTIKRIGVIGSSTAYGTGPPTPAEGFVNLVKNYYKGLGIIDTIYNLAVGGTNVYMGTTTSFVPPGPTLNSADTTINITAVLAKNPDVVLVCYPTNYYEVLTIPEIMAAHQNIFNACVAAGKPCYISGTQPRAQFDAATQAKLLVINDSLRNRFGNYFLDFMTPVVYPGTYTVQTQYDAFDDVHLNAAAHVQLAKIVEAKNLFQTIVSSPAVITTPTTANTTVTGLTAGTHKFNIGVFDNYKLAANAIVTITVNNQSTSSACSGRRILISPDPSDSSVYLTPTTAPSTNNFYPGDTLVFQGAYTSIDVKGLHGTPSCPIVLINQGGQVKITQRMNLDGCTYVKVTGSGTSSQYGFFIEQHPYLRQQYYHAVSIEDRSKCIELERISMHNVDIGIVAETNGQCEDSLNYPNWVMDSIIIHDNRIVGTWNEGMYLGNTSPDNAVDSYDPRPVDCNGVIIYPMPMRNGYTKVYNNYVDSTGRGGIQLASASTGISEIFNNTIKHNGINGDDAQGAAINIGAYTHVYVHNNNITNTLTWGISSMGGSGTNIPLRIENNTIDSSGYLNYYNLATTSATVYDPNTEPVYQNTFTWPQSIEVDTRPTYFTDSTLFWIKGNIIMLKKNNVAINVDNDYNTMQTSGHIICNNINFGSNTPAVLNVVAGISYSSNCAALPNLAPAANAGPDKIITLPTNTVTVSGSGADVDGTIASYLWTKISGPAQYTIVSPTQAQTAINNLVQGVYKFELKVTDNLGAVGRDTMQVTVNAAANIAPVANAGLDKVITLPTNTVTVTGSGTDADGTIASYLWTKISGPAQFTIVSPTQAQSVINNLVQGIYKFELKVTDNLGAVGRDTMQVTVNPAANIPPTANAGADKTITLPVNTVTVTGSGSDPDGTVASSLWSKISGPAQFTIVSPTQVQTVINNLVQGVYQFELKVVDNLGATGRDTMIVTVNAAGNIIPIANAGSDQAIQLPVNTVTVTGSGSDADGSVVSSLWTKISGPAQFTIVSPAQMQTAINNLVQGVYQFELSVTDNLGAVGRDTMTVTVNAAGNIAPVANAGADKTITLPTNTVTVTGSGTDADGTVSAYQWTKVSGPAQYTIVSPTQAQTVINNLVQGVYKFELKVTDNLGATGRDTMTVTVNASNIPPVANAGPDKTIQLPVNTVTVTGSGSDADGTVISSLWTKISGPSQYTIVSPTQAQTVINNLVQGVYQFELAVTDNQGAIGRDTMVVTVIAPNIPPVANAGPNQIITLPVNVVTLNGSGTDADGTVVSYQWAKIFGPSQYSITSASTASTQVVNLIQGVYQFELTVTDNQGATGKDTVTISVNAAGNISPVAIAGPDQSITLPVNTVTVTGSGTDQDGTIASYQWTKVSGPSQYTIVSPTQAQTVINNLVPGVYRFELKVTDNLGAIGTDTLTITVNSAANLPPVANAGADKTITLPTNTVTVTGSGTDADGTVTGYQWTKISGPAQYAIVTPTQAQTIINNLVQGVYRFELRVTDNQGATNADTMTITVNPAPNQPPVANAGADQTIQLPVNSVTVTGVGTDADGNIASYLWTKISGPSQYNIVSPAQAQTVINNLVPGVYQFELKVTDNQGATDRDTITISVAPAANQPPTVTAGIDHTITLPDDSIVLSATAADTDGFISAVQWLAVSGPSQYTINTNSQMQTVVSNLLAGVYVFEVRVVDNAGAFATSRVTVTVKPDPRVKSTAKLYPNPATTTVNITIDAVTRADNSNIWIYDAKGTLVYHEEFARTQQQFTKTVDVSKLTSGAYFVKVGVDINNAVTLKLIKQ
jgi:lysophospholipase L1-like esterase